MSELRLYSWTKKAFNVSSSVMQKCQQAGASGSEFEMREMWSGFYDQEKSKERHQRRPNTAQNNRLLLSKKSKNSLLLVFKMFPGFFFEI